MDSGWVKAHSVGSLILLFVLQPELPPRIDSQPGGLWKCFVKLLPMDPQGTVEYSARDNQSYKAHWVTEVHHVKAQSYCDRSSQLKWWLTSRAKRTKKEFAIGILFLIHLRMWRSNWDVQHCAINHLLLWSAKAASGLQWSHTMVQFRETVPLRNKLPERVVSYGDINGSKKLPSAGWLMIYPDLEHWGSLGVSVYSVWRVW